MSQEPQGRYLEPVFDEVDVTRDIAYRDTLDADGNPVTLHLDIYEPAGDTEERRPVIMFMYGGFFVFGDKTDGYVVAAAEMIAQTGYVAVAINYRTNPDLPEDPGTGAPDYTTPEFEQTVLDACHWSARLHWLT